MRWCLLASTMSYLAYADTIKVTNKTDDPIQVGIVYTKGNDKMLAMDRSTSDFKRISSGATVSIERPGYKYGYDRILVAMLVDPNTKFYKQYDNELANIYRGDEKSLTSLGNEYASNGFAIAGAGYLNGKNFVVSKGRGRYDMSID